MYQPSVKCNNVVHFYKCQSETFSLDNEYEPNSFMSEEESLVILSTTSVLIVNIEESDF